jgi:hypothetical protein
MKTKREIVSEIKYLKARRVRDAKAIRVLKTRLYLDKSVYRADGLGSKLAGILSKLGPLAIILTPILAGATVTAISKVQNKMSDGRIIKRIQSGEIKESDLVRDVANNFLEQFYSNQQNRDAYATNPYVQNSINNIRKAKTFRELREWMDSPMLNKLESLYFRAKRSV